MKKSTVILLFIIGFILVFTVSGVVAFEMLGDPQSEKESENETVLNQKESELPESGITKVTPGINVSDAVVTHSDKKEEVVKTETPEEKKTEKVTEKATEKKTEKVTEKATEKKTEKVTEKATEKKTEKVTEKTTEKKTEKVTEKKEEQKEPEEKVTQAPAEKSTEKPKLDPNKQYSDTGL